MIDLDVTFEERPWEKTLSSLCREGRLSAARFLALMEGEDEADVEEAFALLDEMAVMLDVSDLPSASGGEAALRLRQEVQLVESGMDLSTLKPEEPLRLYLEELAGIASCGDSRILADECAEGKESSRERLLNVSLSRVVQLAGEYVGRGVLLLDLIQEGSLGLWQAIIGFSGGDFESWSERHIRQSMARIITLQARANGVGQKMRQALEDYRAVDERLLGDLGRNATLEEIGQELHMSPEETAVVSKMLESARLLHQAKSANAPREEEPEDAQHVEDTALFQARQRILDLLSGLSEQDAKLLTLRFGLEGGIPLSPEDTGKRLNLTPEEVIAREAAALAQLRNG